MLVFIWVAGSIFGAICEQGVLGPGQQGVLNHVMVWNQVSSSQTWGIVKVITFAPEFFSGIASMLTFNFTFLGGSAAGGYFSWIVLSPLRALIIFGLCVLFILIFRYTMS
jgi:uncharacterized membrane protein